MRYLLINIFVLLCFVGYGQTLEQLQEQRKKTEEQIEYTNKLLKKTETNKKSSLNSINIISRQISNRKELIGTINLEIQLLNAKIVEKNNNILNLENQIEELKKDYAKAIYHTWRTKHAHNRMMYVFSGRDLGEVYRRLRYLHEFTNFRKQQGQMLAVMKIDLVNELDQLQKAKDVKIGLLDKKSQEQYKLQAEQDKQNRYIKELDISQRKLKKQLAEQQQKMDELKKMIEKVIAEQIKKSNEGKADAKEGQFSLTPEEQLVSDQFDKNRGKLPWPVEQGIIISRYGKHTDEVVKTIIEDNPGIDIQTEDGGDARAIFKGEVTYVGILADNSFGVIIRHGQYLSFYANLSDLYVKKGEKVDTKQKIGRIYTDEYSGKTVLHFEIYKGIQRNNPEYWITR